MQEIEVIIEALNNDELLLWQMKNGYALASREGLLNISAQINSLDAEQREQLKDKLKIGIQWDTQVTINGLNQLVSQAYCSALPVAYSHIESSSWESFARLILEATYEGAESKHLNDELYARLFEIGGYQGGRQPNGGAFDDADNNRERPDGIIMASVGFLLSDQEHLQAEVREYRH